MKLLIRSIKYIVLFFLTLLSIVKANEYSSIVIAHNSIPYDSLSKVEIKNIFLGNKTRWKNKKRIVIVIYSQAPNSNTFLKKYVGKTFIQYRNYWKKQIFTGKGNMPLTTNNITNILEFISKNEGTISFVPANTICPDNVKIISIVNTIK